MKITLDFDGDLYRAVKVEAARADRSVREVVAEALEGWLAAAEEAEDRASASEALAEYERTGGTPATSRSSISRRRRGLLTAKAPTPTSAGSEPRRPLSRRAGAAAERHFGGCHRVTPPDSGRRSSPWPSSRGRAGVTNLVGTDFLRLRVGQLRVIYVVDDDAHLVVVLRVARRAESTYRRIG